MTNDEVAPARAVVAGHGLFAEGMIRAVAQITGRSDMFIPISNATMSRDSLEAAMREHIAAGAVVIFTDLPAGSCTIAARKAMRGDDRVTLVTGVNLAGLLDFALHGDRSAAEAAQAAAEKARAAIAVIGGTP